MAEAEFAPGGYIDTPKDVDMDLNGANIYVTYHNVHPEGVTVPQIVPPENFKVTHENDTLTIRSAEGREGGRVNLHVGRGIISDEGTWTLRTTGTVAVHGARITPLKLGSLTAEAGSDQPLTARHIVAEGRVALLGGDVTYDGIVAAELEAPRTPES